MLEELDADYLDRLKERFDEKVDKTGDCHEWQSSLVCGYGQISCNGSMERAHRIAIELDRGHAIPEDKQVNHKCDNRSCVNPEHLYVGTHQDNMIDMVHAGNQTHQKLSVEEANAIQYMTQNPNLTQVEIAEQFGITQQQVSLIGQGKRWGHI